MRSANAKWVGNPLLTDLYQLTMAYGYWKLGMQDQQAAFNLFFRHNPFKGGYAVSAGLATVIEYLNHFKFSPDDLEYLASLRTDQGKILFEKKFLQYLKNLEFACDIHATEEGEIIFPYEPFLRITGPILQCQLLETPLLNLMNFQTLIATKASRVCLAAQGKPVIEFGLRRAQGVDGGISASRAAFIGGCHSTSNTLAGKLYNIPVRGTHAHSWVLAFPTELDSFKAYAKVLPDNCILLVDTFDTKNGIQNALEVAKTLREQGKKFLGLRLDSGDLVKLSQYARKALDKEGFKDAVIIGSGDLDEYSIQKLIAKKAPINVWGVGTRLVTAFDQPALDGVYKLGAIKQPGSKWEYKFKSSENLTKTSLPGLINVRRYFKNKKPVADIIYDEILGAPTSQVLQKQLVVLKQKSKDKISYNDLMKVVYKAGKLVYHSPDLVLIQQNTFNNLTVFDKAIKQFNKPKKYLVVFEKQLLKVKAELLKKTRQVKK